MKRIFQTVFSMLFFSLGLPGQDIIYLKNPSFEEDMPGAGKVATDWLDLGAPNDTPPDIQPGAFSVTIPPQHGNVYLGLVTRDINTWEGVGQELDGFLEKDSVYSFSLWLTRSEIYLSTSKLNGYEANYVKPTVLKIWGVNTRTGQEELLAESVTPEFFKWTQYTFTLKPTVADFNEIDLMAYYAPGFEQKNGNLLIDNCSAIVRVPNRR